MTSLMQSLVVQTSFIGDVILTTPLIAALAKRGIVDVVTTPIGATLLRNNPNVRNVFVYDKRGGHSGVSGFVKFGVGTRRMMRKSDSSSDSNPDINEKSDTYSNFSHDQFDAYLAQGSVRSGALAIALGCKQRVGFGTSSGRRFYTQRITYRDDWHHARRLLSLADYATAAQDTIDLQPRVYPGTDEIAAVDQLLAGRTREFVALAPGSVWATKRWPHYEELAGLLARDVDIALIGGKDDTAIAQTITQRVGSDRIINAIGQLSLLGSAELIRRAQVIVTNDSSPQHLASAVGTPTVTVFGPTVPEFGFGPLAPHSRSVGHNGLACRPCDRHGPQRCPLNHWKCMRDVTAVEVYETLGTVMRGAHTR